LGGDDLYALPQNLRNYLSTVTIDNTLNDTLNSNNNNNTILIDPKIDDFFGGRRLQQLNPPQDFYKGKRINTTTNIFFNSGGAGYVLSQETVRKLYTIGLDHKKCFPRMHNAQEDVMIARCLKDVFDIGLVDTRDIQGRERFHPFTPGTHYTWKPPIPPAKGDWYEEYNRLWPPKLKEQCCAPDSVSFHYMKNPALVRHIHSLLYFC
jgi:glycoprotein-N-acetylgalactosamine 3-beta-galactosyltransferase